MRNISILALLPALLLLSACSVREDRRYCPGWLHLELSSRSVVLSGGLPTMVSVFHGGGKEAVSLSEAVPEEWIAVEKGMVEVSALLGNGASDPPAWGDESDSLWAFSTSFRMDNVEKALEVRLHKRFATIWFVFEEIPDPEQSCLMIRSREDFRCILDTSNGETAVRLPARSGDAPLELRCLSSDGKHLLWEWDLGEALLAAGYDWGAEDLSDARVRVSLAPLDISVTVVPWEGNGGLILEI